MRSGERSPTLSDAHPSRPSRAQPPEEDTMHDLVLVAYASRHGTTHEVARAIANRLHTIGVHVELAPAAEIESLDRYGAVVLGGALYVGRWHRDARAFLRRHRAELATIPVAVFALGPRSLSESDLESSRDQLERALSHVPEVAPLAVAIFGGAIHPETLRFPLNHLPAFDARDWVEIARWADEVAAGLEQPALAGAR
jgi:menaquinone-dependent protoporphyrinogen oxidase